MTINTISRTETTQGCTVQGQENTNTGRECVHNYYLATCSSDSVYKEICADSCLKTQVSLY